MGELESSSGSGGVRRSGRLVSKRSNGPVKVVDVDDDDDDDDDDVGEVGLLEVVEEEEWEPGAGRKSARKRVLRRTKRGEKGTSEEKTLCGRFDAVDAVSRGLGSVDLSGGDKGNSRDAEVVRDVVNGVKSCVQGEAKSCPRDVAFENIVRSLVEDKGESGAQEFILDAVRKSLLQDKLGNLHGAKIVLNAVPQGLVVVDASKDSIMERPFVRIKEEVIDLSSSSSDDRDEGDDCIDDESAGEQEEIDTTLSREDTALFAEVTKVLREEGDLKKFKVDHLKAYLRRHGLRMSGVKAVLLSRCEDHLRFKDGQAENIYPRSSFTINCKGDVCLGDTVLFLQNAYDSFDIVSRSAKPLGKRWVAGKVVNESYGAGKQQHTFTIEVLWSTGTRPFYVMRPLQIKGRNLYRINTMRQPWSNEADRQKVLDEKHARGAEARAQRRAVTGSSSRGHSRSKPSSSGHPNTRDHTNTRDQGGESRSILPTIPPSHNSMQHERNHTQQINVRQGSTAAHTHTRNRPAETDRIPPTILPSHNSMQHERNRTQQINVRQGNTAAHSHTRNRPAETDRIPPTIPPFQNSIQYGRADTERHGWAYTDQQGRAHAEQHGRTQTDQQGRTHTEQHGRTQTEQHGRTQTEQHGRTQTNQQGRTHTEQHGRTYIENHVYRGSTGAQGIVHMGCSTRGCENAGAKHCISRSCASCCYRNSSTRGSCPRHQ